MYYSKKLSQSQETCYNIVMLRATVYSNIELGPDKKQAISDGLDVLGQYVGGISIARFAGCKVRTDMAGEATKEVSGNNLDKQTIFHLFVHPLQGYRQGLMGSAYTNTGVAHIDSRSPGYLLSPTVTHETAHALGFVLPEAPQSTRAGLGHCGTKTCVMHPTVNAGDGVLDRQTADQLRQLHNNLDKLELGMSGNAKELWGDHIVNDGFCTPCVADLRAEGEDQAKAIFYNRLVSGSVLTAEQIRSSRVN